MPIESFTLSSWLYLLLFLPVAFAVYAAVPRKWRWVELLAVSYAFLLCASGELLVFTAAATVVVWAGALVLERMRATSESLAPPDEDKAQRKERLGKLSKRMRWVMLACVVVVLGILAALKYNVFMGQTIDALLAVAGVPQLFADQQALVMPLGISFYSLMAASYVIDVYRGKYPACKNLGTVALFVAFFPQLTEGPIGRFDLMATSLRAGNIARRDDLACAVQLILWGLFKKIVIADRLNPLVGDLFTNHADYAGVMIALAAVLYTIQLYADFSGVVDIARGSAQLFGVTLSPNFRQPFFASNANEFWRRWHITLGAWLRDYVFYPITLSGLTRRIKRWCKKHVGRNLSAVLPATFALLAVWFCCGLWHGASWKYVLYGIYYFAVIYVGMFCEPLIVKFFKSTGFAREGKTWHRLAVLRTLVVVCIGMMLFRADTLGDFGQMFVSMFAGAGLEPLLDGSWLTHGTDAYDLLVVAISVAIMLVIGIVRERGISMRSLLIEHGTAVRWIAGFCLLTGVVVLGAYGAGYEAVPSIYAGF